MMIEFRKNRHTVMDRTHQIVVQRWMSLTICIDQTKPLSTQKMSLLWFLTKNLLHLSRLKYEGTGQRRRLLNAQSNVNDLSLFFPSYKWLVIHSLNSYYNLSFTQFKGLLKALGWVFALPLFVECLSTHTGWRTADKQPLGGMASALQNRCR